MEHNDEEERRKKHRHDSQQQQLLEQMDNKNKSSNSNDDGNDAIISENQQKTETEGKEAEELKDKKKQFNFVLIHGPCHGGWQWYKVVTLLRSEGHKVTALDLAGCGADPTRLEDLHSFNDYTRPLIHALASLPPEERVIAVGHCYNGYVLSLAMEKFSQRIAVAVFATAFMPKHSSSPTSTFDEFLQRDHIESLMDCQLSFDPEKENPLTSFTFGPEFMAKVMYQCCPTEDVTLATLLVRPSGLFLEDISNETMLSEANYGSVNRVYIISKQDKLYSEDYQRWIVESNPPKEVKEIEGSDHMIMLSKPQELVQCLLEIADNYA